MALKILINGAKGRMGHAIAAAAEAAGLQWVGCDMGDNPGDFYEGLRRRFSIFPSATHNRSFGDNLRELKKPLVIGTTGHSPGTARRNPEYA